ncbi:MAG: ATP-binding cassette domain-containing protein [Proteobacteria bacterium]|nr:ATP-binding cassette domain-containing protein [Pseudomonadota bacterium]
MRDLLKSPISVLVVCGLLLPPFTYAFGLTYTTASEILIYAIAGLGFNLLLGYTGLVSFGHGIFFGVAAYAASIIQVQLMPGYIFIPMVLAVAISTLFGAIIGYFSLRLRGVYFSLLTLSFAAMTFYIIYRWTSFTGGEDGYGGMDRPTIMGLDLNDQLVFFFLVFIIFTVVSIVAWRIVRSPFGSVLKAIRENSQRAAYIGYDVRRYRLIVFIISASIVGIAGSLFPFLKYYIGAELVHVQHSGEILAMSILGGSRHFLGPPLGALFFILLRELLSEYTASWQLIFGILFMGFILFSPTGLMGLGSEIIKPLIKRTRKAAMASRVAPAMWRAVPEYLRNSGHDLFEGSIFECRGVGKRFGNFVAVSDVNLRVKDRTLQSLIGPNGAGKTTLFNVMSGEYEGDSGELLFLGMPLTKFSPDILSQAGIARSFQITNLFPDLTVFENLRLGVQSRHRSALNMWRDARSIDEINSETDSLLDFLGLKGLENVEVSSLSYGGQRLLEIGLALATRPRFLLLDEPLVGLAAQERERITGLIKALSEYIAILFIEHDIDRVFSISDNITVMNQATVLASGTPDQIRGNKEVQVAYLGSGKAFLKRQSQVASTIDPDTRILQLDTINTFYGKSHILTDVSLEVFKGEVVALLGRNGAGKSSTIKSIMGMAPIASGRIVFNGTDISSLAPEKIARMGIGLVPQGRRLFANLTVEENLNIGALRRTGGEGVRWDIARIFEQFPRIQERYHAKADTLSGGEQQMVAIARALAGNVQLILMDEPFEGLSPTMVEELFENINRLRSEVSIIIIEHQLDLVLALADRTYILDRGVISHHGPAKPLLDDLSLRKEKLWV